MSLRRVWRRLSLTVKFALIIAVVGVLIAIIPLYLATRESQSQATLRAADKAGIAANLVRGQEASLRAFAQGMAQELSPSLLAGDTTTVSAVLTRYSQVNTPSDVVGVAGTVGSWGVQAGRSILTKGDLFPILARTAHRGNAVVAGPDGTPWLVAGAAPPSGDAIVFIARHVDQRFLQALEGTITTSADPAGIAVVRRGRVAASGSTLLRQPAPPGATLSPSFATLIEQASAAGAITDMGGADAGVGAQPLGDDFVVVVTTPVASVSTLWQPVAILLCLIAVAMFLIVLIVQVDLQRPLRRLDRAVAAMGRDEYDVPLPHRGDDELGRLASSFDEMRRQLRATVTGARARAVIGTELNSPQPLETALNQVCAELREAMSADAAFIMVNGSEMTDSFAVLQGVNVEPDVAGLLAGGGPIGVAFRHTAPEPLQVSATAGSLEARCGMREFCAAPLRMGRSVLGVLGVARYEGGFTTTESSLISGTAEQVALALERYRFIAMVQRQASIDDLTGLYNHRFLVDYLGQQVALAERLNTPLAILVIDLDHFKRVNDTYGHPAGDVVLSMFAQTLTHNVRRADLAARYGGEEFIVVMSNTAALDARRVAEKIRAAADAMVIPVEGGHIGLTVSIGGAAYPEDTTTARELLATADSALYDAKRCGRNRVCMAGDVDAAGEVPSNVTTVVRPRRSAQ